MAVAAEMRAHLTAHRRGNQQGGGEGDEAPLCVALLCDGVALCLPALRCLCCALTRRCRPRGTRRLERRATTQQGDSVLFVASPPTFDPHIGDIFAAWAGTSH
eukprot:gene24766-4285_t